MGDGKEGLSGEEFRCVLLILAVSLSYLWRLFQAVIAVIIRHRPYYLITLRGVPVTVTKLSVCVVLLKDHSTPCGIGTAAVPFSKWGEKA